MSASARILTIISASLFLEGMLLPARAVLETTVTFSMADIDFSQTDGYDILNVEGCHLEGEPGQPLLPCKAINFVIPRGQDVSEIILEDVEKIKLPGDYLIYPAQQDKPGNDNDFSEPDPETYGSTDPFPPSLTSNGHATTGWGWKLYQVLIWPLEYIPAKREIWLVENLTIRLQLRSGTDGEQEIVPRSFDMQEEWTGILERAVVNSEDIRTFAPGEFSGSFSTRRWVLILPGAPLESIERDLWYNAFQPLINHRSNQGLDVEVKYVGEITSASGEAAVDDIREYLLYQHSNHNAQWVCLAGDDEMIPWSYRNITASAPYFDPDTQIPNDWCYCDLDGEWIEYQPGMDWAPEMWVGRIPCITPTEGSNFVDKVLAYEQNPGGGDYSYLNRALYESADQMTDDATCEQVIAHQHGLLDTTLLTEQPSGSDPDTISPWAWQVRDKINSTGYNYFVVHCHGRECFYATMSYGYEAAKDLFGSSEIASLTNEDQYFFLYSMACLNAHIDNTPNRTFVEMITCMFPNRGAIAFAGYTRYGAAGDCPSSTNLNCHAWDQLFPDLFFPWCFNHVGAVEARSKTQGYFVPDVGNEHLFGHNLFGDPATPIWTPDYTPTMNKPLLADPATEVITLSDMRLYPSPTGANCTASFSLHQRSPVDIDLYDVTGRTVWTCRIPTLPSGNFSQSLDLSGMTSGTYVLLLKATGTAVSDRIIICR